MKHWDAKVLEISTKSENCLGVSLKAFKLAICEPSSRACSVESAFQASKVFEEGGPYTGLLDDSSAEAKRDVHLRIGGPVEGFRFGGHTFATSPKRVSTTGCTSMPSTIFTSILPMHLWSMAPLQVLHSISRGPSIVAPGLQRSMSLCAGRASSKTGCPSCHCVSGTCGQEGVMMASIAPSQFDQGIEHMLDGSIEAHA